MSMSLFKPAVMAPLGLRIASKWQCGPGLGDEGHARYVPYHACRVLKPNLLLNLLGFFANCWLLIAYLTTRES